jgi:hypothetical protein
MNRKQTRLAREAQANATGASNARARRTTVWETADIQSHLQQEGDHAQRVWASCVQAGMSFGTRGAMGQRVQETDKRHVRR